MAKTRAGAKYPGQPHLFQDIDRQAGTGVFAEGGDSASTLNRGFENEKIAKLPDAVWSEGPGTGAKDPYATDIERYQKLGTETQAPVTLDQRKADESRDLQMGALGLMRAQANGAAPSSAGILAGRANENAVRNAGLAATSAKTAGGGIVAARGAEGAFTGPKGALAQNAANAGARLGEISTGQTGLASGAIGAQGQDTGAATANARLEMQQHALGERRQQGYEQMAFDTKHSQLQNVAQAQRTIQRNEAAQRAEDAVQKEADETGGTKTVSTIAGGIFGGVGSDERLKTKVRPVYGSLSSLGRR